MRVRAQAILVLLLGAVVAAGCGTSEPTQPRHPAHGVSHGTPVRPAAERVRFQASDGRRVSAEYTAAGRDAPAVVLLHEIRGGPDQWAPLVPYLHAAGFAALAYESRASVLERERLPDVLGAIRWLRARSDVDRRRIALAGASIGASTAVLAMASGARRSADAAVALSPPDSADIWKLQAERRYRPHDLLLISDDREASSAKGMLEGAIRSSAIRSKHAGHGVALLGEPHVRAALLAWLEKHVAR